MSYQTTVVTSIADVISDLITFAGAEGWTVGGTGTVPTFTPPSGGSPVQVERNNVGSFDGMDLSIPALSTNKARLNNPYIDGTGSTPDTPAPSLLHLHGGTEEGIDFIAGVIEFSTVGYRHFYIGALIPVGTFTGGQVIAANWHYTSNESYNFPFNANVACKFMFGACNQVLAATDSGFAHIVAGAADSIRVNKSGAPSPAYAPENTLGANVLLGGATDGPNDALVARGQVHYSSATVLVPVNMYVTEGSPARLRPVGRPAGVRLVNMTNYDEAQQIQIGIDNWRVYPEFKKTTSAYVARGTSYGEREASYFWGLAYPEGL
jgi:hypothetical protein